MTSKSLQNKPHQLLAKALAQAKTVSREGVVKAINLDRSTKEILTAAGCLTEVIKGWYLLTSPLSQTQGQSIVWYGGCWAFLNYYLQDRFGKNGYCFSAESSMNLHAGEPTIAHQWTVLTRETSNHVITLPQQSSLFLYSDKNNFPSEFDRKNGLNIMTLPQALTRLPPSYYTHKPLNVELVLRSFSTISEISRTLLETQGVTAANRIVGAYKALKESSKASQISEDLSAAGFTVKPINPFTTYEPT